MQEQWYRWYGSDEKEQTTGVERMDGAPDDFVPHLFQMDEMPFQALLLLVLSDWLGAPLRQAGVREGAPDLRITGGSTRHGPSWYEVKPAALRPTLRWDGNEEGQSGLDAQVRHYAKKFPDEEPNVIGYGLSRRWDQPRLKFHVVQPGILRTGGAALRLLWDLPEDPPAGLRADLKKARFLEHRSLFRGPLKHLAAEFDLSYGWRKKSHMKRMRTGRKGVRIQLRLWPDESGRPQLHLKYDSKARDTKAAARLESLVGGEGHRFRIPLSDSAEPLLTQAAHRRLDVGDWKEIGALDALREHAARLRSLA